MQRADLKARVERSRFARFAMLPWRLRAVGAYNGRQLKASARWLVRSREHTNFTYPLTDLNLGQLRWFVANATGRPVSEISGYMDELVRDGALAEQLAEARLRDPEWRLSDPEPKFGRRLGWYALVRALKPEHVVETGTDKGLGTMVLAAAVLANGRGRVTTVDTREHAGYLISGKWAEVVDFRVGDSAQVIPTLSDVGFFIHDSLHTAEHEMVEYGAVGPLLTADGIVASDNAHVTDALMRWSEREGRRFAYFQEITERHWYPGAGLGLSIPQ